MIFNIKEDSQMILQELLKKADSYKEKIQSSTISKEKTKSLDDYFRIELAYSSNALEGNTLTLSEVKNLIEEKTFPNNKNLQDSYEIIGHAAAYDYMLTLARQTDLTITENIIQELHALFYQKIDTCIAGQYRNGPTYISETQYVPPESSEIPRLMEHFINQIDSSKNHLHPIELAAMCHKRLVDIHPFINGNGPIARLFMNIILVNAGYGVVSITPDLQHDYTKALVISRTTQDVDPLIKLIAECVIEAEKDSLKC